MSIKSQLLISIAFFILLLHSCISDYPIEVGYSESIVVNCILTNDTVQQLTLTKTSKMNEHLFAEIKDAKVDLFEEGEFVGRFEKVAYALWELRYIPKKGRRYSLKVETDEGKVLNAQTTMPVDLEIIPLTGKKIKRTFKQLTANFPVWIFTVGHSGGVAEKVYYYPEKGFTLSTFPRTNHPLADGFNHDEIVDSLSSYFFYIRVDGTHGFEPLDFAIGNSSEFVFFRTVSFEYDQYLKTSMQKMLNRLDEYDPTVWFDESKVYSNIENGLGVFGAYTDHYFYYFWQELYYEMKDGVFIMY